MYDGNYGNSFVYSDNGNTGLGLWATNLINPEEIWNVDTKLDDGKSGTGKIVIGRRNYVCDSGAATSADFANASYRLNTSDKRCVIVFREVF